MREKLDKVLEWILIVLMSEMAGFRRLDRLPVCIGIIERVLNCFFNSIVGIKRVCFVSNHTTNYLSLKPYRSQLRSSDFKTPASHESQWFASSFRTVACGSEGSEKLSHRRCRANPTEEQHQWQEHRPANGCTGGH